MKYNPFGPADRTMEGGRQIAEILKDRTITTVCGYNYVVDYPE
jgi:hydroxyacylglutathione hydrolase